MDANGTMAESRTAPYPLNQWYAAAYSDEITTKPLARTLLDRHVALFRLENGEPAALIDRCPHRKAPLSKGAVVGTTIECPFHGLRFAANGTCVLIPCQDKIPPIANVRAFPVLSASPSPNLTSLIPLKTYHAATKSLGCIAARLQFAVRDFLSRKLHGPVAPARC